MAGMLAAAAQAFQPVERLLIRQGLPESVSQQSAQKVDFETSAVQEGDKRGAVRGAFLFVPPLFHLKFVAGHSAFDLPNGGLNVEPGTNTSTQT